MNNNIFKLKHKTTTFSSEYTESMFDIVGVNGKMLSVYRLWKIEYNDTMKKSTTIGIQSVDDKKKFLWQFKKFEIYTEEELESIILDLIKNNNIRNYYSEADCIIKLDRDIKHKDSFNETKREKEFLFKKNNEYVLRYYQMEDTHTYIVLYDDNIYPHYFKKVQYPNGSLYESLNHTDENYECLFNLYYATKNN